MPDTDQSLALDHHQLGLFQVFSTDTQITIDASYVQDGFLHLMEMDIPLYFYNYRRITASLVNVRSCHTKGIPDS